MESAVETLRNSATAPMTLTPAAEAQQLETQIGDIRSDQADEVMRVRRACHQIPGGILRMIRDEAEDQKEPGE
jgi:hypothetical protein